MALNEVLFFAKDDNEVVRLYLASSSIVSPLPVLLVVFGNILGSQTDLKWLSPPLIRPSLVAGGHGMGRLGSCRIVLLLLMQMKMLMLRISIQLLELLMLRQQLL